MGRKPASGRSGWKQDPEGVRNNILSVARAEFADTGLSGARIDEIAAKTNTSKRMIYYYFGDKEDSTCGRWRVPITRFDRVRPNSILSDFRHRRPWRGWSSSPSTTTISTRTSSAW